MRVSIKGHYCLICTMKTEAFRAPGEAPHSLPCWRKRERFSPSPGKPPWTDSSTSLSGSASGGSGRIHPAPIHNHLREFFLCLPLLLPPEWVNQDSPVAVYLLSLAPGWPRSRESRGPRHPRAGNISMGSNLCGPNR